MLIFKVFPRFSGKDYLCLIDFQGKAAPKGFALLQVPWEYFFGLKLKIYVKIIYLEHFGFNEKKILYSFFGLYLVNYVNFTK